MEQVYFDKMSKLGFDQLVCEIFPVWENVKDEILIPERKTGTGNGTIHVFLGMADAALRREFPTYYHAVENGENPAEKAITITHYFLYSNVLSMLGHLCWYNHSKNLPIEIPVIEILSQLATYSANDELMATTSLFKLSIGSSKPRPYFKQFDNNGVFSKIIRPILLPNSAYKVCLLKNRENEYAAFWLLGFGNLSDFEVDSTASSLINHDVEKFSLPLQQIFYGAPGTGKSHKVKNITETAYPNEEERDEFVSRTTFHPDYDYASFVGCYKPKKEDDKITYSFVPQVFTNAYIKAWKEMKNEEPKPVYLVIEEINRGNCAQIFGDLFQLLDRGDDGYSEYPIDIDDDLKNYLIEKLGSDSEGVKDGKMCLPPNLNIWATMNTSDQSLFPMDSAFKRRWEWEYVKIADAGKNWKIKLDDGFELIDWWTFLKRINRVVAELTTSEDKQLGYFFCKPDVKLNNADEEPTIISAKRFVNKVIFYLWNDVFKGYAYDADCCKDVNQKEVLYEKFYSEDGTSPEIEVLKVFFDKLKNEGEASLVVDGTTDGDTPQPEESTNETAAEGNETEA